MGTIVHEWCLNWREPFPRLRLPPAAPAGAAPGAIAIRWSAPSASSSLPPDFRYSDYGFRVLRET